MIYPSMSLILINLICFLLMIMSLLISKKMMINREKNSPYECGFDPKMSPRIPFSVHFFLITLLFLIFDIEISLLLPLFISNSLSNMKTLMLSTSIIMNILIIGILLEWNQSILNWKI
uniref:NADH-ubiquinone oxidoreductase chain 3 n=1 Tax=Dipseudopsis sp. XG-2021 TaxID=2996733 RepID=A0A9E8RUP9_9NEOP|nr:NADH dehydrogenase subunit 3 [Dipseudopsis sp. XG-2021]